MKTVMALKSVVNRSVLEQLEQKNVVKLLEIMNNLYGLWENVGIDEKQEINRATQVWNYIFLLLKDIEDEEITLNKEIKERISNYEKKISVLNTELQLPKAEELTSPLIQKEETLRQLLDKLSKIKHKRLKEYQRLHLQELEYCRILGIPPSNVSLETGVPTDNDINELQHHINLLQEEKESRQQKFCRLKKELSTILEITELTPETPFEKEILTLPGDTLSFSTENFKLLEQIINKTKKKQIDLENEKSFLIENLSRLWDILKIGQKERELFLSRHNDCRVSNLNAIKQETARCEEIKIVKFSKYIDFSKEELISLWKKCFISYSENMLPYIQENEITKTDLENYDNEVTKWKKYYKDTEHIIQKISKRQELWEQMMIFENKAVDPNRFKNRGGHLLKEERQRKQLQKALPELEENILVEIQKYERETGKHFLYYGEKYEVVIKNQWEGRFNQMENEKLTKQKVKLRQSVNEQNKSTPSKKQLFSRMTPKSAPSKLLKSVFKTPNFSVSKQIPRSVSHLNYGKDPNYQTKISKKNVLREKNKNKPVSENLDRTTYVDFAAELNRPSRINHRSSVLSSKMVIGTRLSLNKSKQKSVNKFAKKSIQKKVTVTK